MVKKMRLPLLLLLISISTFTNAQKNTYTIGSPEDISRLPKSFRFLYPDFRKGYVLFAMNKRSAVFPFNYDLLSETLMFINDKNDTLVVKEKESIKYAHFTEDSYYYHVSKGLLKILATDTLHKLVSKEELTRHPLKRVDEGYGGNNSGATPSVSLSRVQDYVIERNISYYLIDKNGRAVEANKPDFLKAFDKKREQIRLFVKTNHIKFNIESDLIKVFHFCVQP